MPGLAVLALETTAVSAAAIGVAVASLPPADLGGWLRRQDWVRQMGFRTGEPDPAGTGGLRILPWTEPGGSAQRSTTVSSKE